MSATLVIMAAGLASRYGSAKQIEKVGPAGEILMEYTLYDAKKAGFDRFVIILPPGIKEEFRDLCGNRHRHSGYAGDGSLYVLSHTFRFFLNGQKYDF